MLLKRRRTNNQFVHILSTSAWQNWEHHKLKLPLKKRFCSTTVANWKKNKFHLILSMISWKTWSEKEWTSCSKESISNQELLLGPILPFFDKCAHFHLDLLAVLYWKGCSIMFRLHPMTQSYTDCCGGLKVTLKKTPNDSVIALIRWNTFKRVPLIQPRKEPQLQQDVNSVLTEAQGYLITTTAL